MTSIEIEDVLSSIRRLVSEGLRPAAQATDRTTGADKLILTPAFRVVSDDEPEETREAAPDYRRPEPAGALSQELSHAFRALEEVGPASFADDLADAGASLPHPAEGSAMPIETPVRDAPEAGSIEAVVAVVGAAVEPQDWEAEVEASRPETADWSTAGWTDPLPPEPLPDTNVIAFAAPGETPPAGWVEDGSADTIVEPPLILGASRGDRVRRAEHPDTAAQIERVAARIHFAGISDQPPEQAVPQEEVGSVAADAAMPQPDRLAAHAMALDEAAEDQAALAGPDVLDDAALECAVGTVADHAAERIRDAAAAIDPEELRKIVREIIREELQGSLGERITRNVRKLVRVEINRAMATQDIE